MLIGILNCGHFTQRPDTPRRDYDTLYREMLDGFGFEFKAWHVIDMEFPESVRDADGWLLGGSRHGVYDDIPFIAPLLHFVREAYSADIPVAGSCFGHQLIAEALGGRVEKYSGGWGIGHADYDFEGRRMTLTAFHQEQVTQRPPDARVIGTNAFCENAALAYAGSAFSGQAHPEFGEAEMDLLLDMRAPKLVDQAMIDAARSRGKEPNQNTEMAAHIARFFKGATL